MKNQITEKLFTFILLISGVFSFTVANAQSCPSGKVWACRYDACSIQECKCINASQVQSWTATIPPCNWHFLHHCGGCTRTGENGTDMEIEASLEAYPNPVTGSTTISFSLERSQNVSLSIFDVNGRLVSTIADKTFEEGENEIEFNAEKIDAGIYFLKVQAGDILKTKKLVVTK